MNTISAATQNNITFLKNTYNKYGKGLATLAFERTPEADAFVPSKDNVADLNANNAPQPKQSNFFNTIYKRANAFFATKDLNKDGLDFLPIETAKLSVGLANDVYRTNKRGFGDYELVQSINNKQNGFSAAAYSNGKDVYISYAGTDDAFDMKSDYDLMMGKIPQQYSDAKSFYDIVKSTYPDKNITLTGHSLGGSLAQLVASTAGNDVNAITFAAFGTREIIENNPEMFTDSKTTYNYISEKDVVSNSSKHIGHVCKVPIGSFNNHSVSNYVKYFDTEVAV